MHESGVFNGGDGHTHTKVNVSKPAESFTLFVKDARRVETEWTNQTVNRCIVDECDIANVERTLMIYIYIFVLHVNSYLMCVCVELVGELQFIDLSARL